MLGPTDSDVPYIQTHDIHDDDDSGDEHPMTTGGGIFFVFLGAFGLILLAICITHTSERRSRHRSASNCQGDSDPEEADLPNERYFATCTALAPVTEAETCTDKRVESEENDSSDCPICLGSIKAGDLVSWSPVCRHSFHNACLSDWVTRRKECPFCRAAMIARDEEAPVENLSYYVGRGLVAESVQSTEVDPNQEERE